MSNDSHPWRSGLKLCILLGLIVRLLTAVAVEQEFGWDSVTHLSCMHALQLTLKIIPQSSSMAGLSLIQSLFKTIENLARALA